MTFLKRHFPQHWSTWKKYLRVFLPIIAGSTLFALNGVVDNFMVGRYAHGQEALGAVNSWTAILMGWFAGTAAAGSVVLAQFYHARKFDTVRQIARYRFTLCFGMAIVFACFAWANPNLLISVFHSGGSHSDPVYTQGRSYAHVIAIQWLLIALTFNYGNQLRELGYGKVTMYWGIGTLTANITLNATLMYGFGMGVEGAAWASVAGRLVSLGTGVIFFRYKKLPVSFAPWTFWKTSWEVQKLYWKRWIYFMAVFTVTFFVTFRTHFYDAAYPTDINGNSTLGNGFGGLAVVSLTGSIMNIFTTTFNALTAMSANFVGSELGKGNMKEAKYNSDKLKGFNTTVSAFFSLILVCFALGVPYMHFFVKDVGGVEGGKQLIQVSHSLFIIALFYPIWIWFSTSYRNGMAGGKGGKFAFVDWAVSGLQLGWLAVMGLFIAYVPGGPENFWMFYALFFASDLFKMLFQEIFYYKYDWLHSLTHTEEEIQHDASNDYSRNEKVKP